jgi:cell division protein FtsB
MVVIAMLFVFGFPARSLLAQRHERERALAQLDVLREQNTKLEREARRLQDNAEIERIARERYGLVRPGETPYVVVPPSTAPPAAPSTTASAPSTTAPKRP